MTSPAIVTKAAVAVAKSAAGILPQEGKTAVLEQLVSDMTAAALGALSPKAQGKLLQALASTEAATLPASKTAPTITIEQMKEALRAADCLYDIPEIWRMLGAKEVPVIPDTVIQKAYDEGGRVVLKCSSISDQANALRVAGHDVYFDGTAEQRHYAENMLKPKWIVVQSHIDRKTLGFAKRDVVTADKPAPTPEDWFAAIAYAKLYDGRQPKGCENKWAFTSESGTVVGSFDDRIGVHGKSYLGRYRFGDIGAPRFGRPLN
jgi:hypothetical protein